MKFEKKHLRDLHRCYATGSLKIDNERHIVIATEGEGSCYMYSPDDFKETTIWENPGGTMCTVQIPNKNGDFLAVQNFFPTFNSKEAIIVWSKQNQDGTWSTKKIMDLPYVHRFDILTSENGVNYFIGATLCTSKEFKDDWSDPGKIYVGIVPEDLNEKIELKVIKEGLTKNHGYCKANWDGKESSIITCEEGAFIVTPPQSEGQEWKIEQILNRPISDIAVVDIDNDGVDELVTIEQFHGNKFLINKKIDGKYEIVYQYPKEIDFAHAIWAGELRGVKTILGGYRRNEKELFYIQCDENNPLKFKYGVIDNGVGPSNVDVINTKDRDIIISANREIGEAALYIVTE